MQVIKEKNITVIEYVWIGMSSAKKCDLCIFILYLV